MKAKYKKKEFTTFNKNNLFIGYLIFYKIDYNGNIIESKISDKYSLLYRIKLSNGKTKYYDIFNKKIYPGYDDIFNLITVCGLQKITNFIECNDLPQITDSQLTLNNLKKIK